MKKADSSNIQGVANDVLPVRGQPNEILQFDSERSGRSGGDLSTGEIITEKSDITRLQDEDFRSRVTENASHDHSIPDDYVTVDHQTSLSDYDPVVHPDARVGRLRLSVQYDDQHSHLNVQLIDAEGLIRPDQNYAPEMVLTFSLIGPYQSDEKIEKHTRVVVENAAVTWKHPMTFAITLDNAIKQNLYVSATNETDPAAPNDREVSLSFVVCSISNSDLLCSGVHSIEQTDRFQIWDQWVVRTRNGWWTRWMISVPFFLGSIWTTSSRHINRDIFISPCFLRTFYPTFSCTLWSIDLCIQAVRENILDCDNNVE